MSKSRCQIFAVFRSQISVAVNLIQCVHQSDFSSNQSCITLRYDCSSGAHAIYLQFVKDQPTKKIVIVRKFTTIMRVTDRVEYNTTCFEGAAHHDDDVVAGIWSDGDEQRKEC